MGEQESALSNDPPCPVDDDILLSKLRPKQSIELDCHCYKGIGRDHAKFSPVATAFYRMHPVVHIKKPIYDDDARLLKSSFGKGVIDIIQDPETGREKAVVASARKDTCSRNVLRYPELASRVTIGLDSSHFIFSVESTGALKSEELVLEALDILKQKCARIRNLIK